MSEITNIKFTESEWYEIKGGWFHLIGVTDSLLLFTLTRNDSSKVPLKKVKQELKPLLERLQVEENCKKKGGACGSPKCGNCHPENFEKTNG